MNARTWPAVLLALLVLLPVAGAASARTVQGSYVTSAPVPILAASAPVAGEDVHVGGVRVPVETGEDRAFVLVQDVVGWPVSFQLHFLGEDGQGIGASTHCGSWSGPMPGGTATLWVVPTVTNVACPLSSGGPATTGSVNVALDRSR